MKQEVIDTAREILVSSCTVLEPDYTRSASLRMQHLPFEVCVELAEDWHKFAAMLKVDSDEPVTLRRLGSVEVKINA